ncbi:hypothetical protein [Citrobacter freundii]|uniref:hypothetical protein n=1 Tax=Citrobacter freundii TaxID=546 RepID=UPI00374F1D3E
MAERSNIYDAENLFSGKNFAKLGDDSLNTTTSGGDGGGSDMNGRMTRIETIANNHEKLISDTRQEMIGIRGDMHGMERRLADKMDENQKWLIALMISAILAPLFIALVTK